MKRTLSFVTLIIVILSLCSCDTASTKYPKQIELVEYIGEELSTVEAELSAELKDMTQYFDSTYRFEAETTLVDFAIDNTGKIVQIHLWDSGELGYTLCGLTTEMDDVSAENKLSENSAVFVRGKVWQCANKTDCITRENSGWIYIANSEILEEQLLLAKMENALTFQYEDSEGIYYIGNNQFVEYYYSSFPRFKYEYEKMTEYQLSIWNEANAGRYLMVAGTVNEVTDRGTVMVECKDQSFDKEVGNKFPTVGFAELTLVPEQESLLISLAENATIVAFGRIVPDSYDSFYDIYFDLSDTIVLTVDSSAVTVPVLERPISGITRFDESGNILLDYNAFWDSVSWYDDEITGEYFSSENFIYFDISAGKSEKGEVTYWLTYQAGSETKEIDGDIMEIPRYLNLPSKQIWTEASRIIVEFAVDGYCEYTGSFYLIKEYRDNGNFIDYICVDIPGFLSTSNTELYVAKN